MSAAAIQAPAGAMLKLLEELAAFSAPGPGVTRLLYTKEWCAAQQYISKTMAGLGLDVRIDRVGNVYGRLAGTADGGEAGDKVILTGSHIDTVRCGGKYDGAYGVAAAVTALGYLRERFGPPLRTVEAVSFSEEEGSRFPLAFWGSGHVTGLYNGSEAEQITDPAGVTLRQAMEDCGLLPFEPAGSGDAISGSSAGDGAPSGIAAYIELHIEQGIVLEEAGLSLGVVEAIVGQRRAELTVRGSANHAGSTPMRLRRDALAGAAEMLAGMEQLAVAAGDPLVATSGRLETFPGTPNVIPGEVCFTVDIRHSEAAALEDFCTRVFAEFAAIAARRGLELQVKETLSTAPAAMDLQLRRSLERICREQGRSWRSMVSGAGHDAQLFAPLCPSAMLFVPSRGGISHAPEEYTSPEELAAGLDILTTLLYELAYQ